MTPAAIYGAIVTILLSIMACTASKHEAESKKLKKKNGELEDELARLRSDREKEFKALDGWMKAAEEARARIRELKGEKARVKVESEAGGYKRGQAEEKQNAINADVAHYVLNEKTGEIEFQYKTPSYKIPVDIPGN